MTVTVTNTGSRPGREVVQLYWRPGSDGQPVRLVGWSAVTAEPGESVPVTVAADARLRRRWGTEQGTWLELPWDGALHLARGLGDVRATLELPGG